MLPDPPHIAEMVLTDLPAERLVEFQTAHRKWEATKAEVVAAEARLADAHAAHEALAQRAAEVGGVSARETNASHNAVVEAERYVIFSRSIVHKSEALKIAAEQRYTSASAESYAPVLEAGIAKRIDAAARITAAQEHLARARSDFDDGTLLVRHAMNRGLAVNLPPGGPLSMPGWLPPEARGERFERMLWDRPTTKAA